MSDTSSNPPTLSVLLPTYGDRWRLGTQLAAVLPQLRPNDEVVCVVQCGGETEEFFRRRFMGAPIKWVFVARPLGVCGAYNMAASLATRTWIAQLSANDEWQAGTHSVWLDAATRWPDSVIMHGHTIGMTMTPWMDQTGFFPKHLLHAVWLQQGWKLHGSSTFIRRDAWGDGYPPTLGYMADQFLAMKLTMLNGCVYLRHKCSYVNFLPSGASQAHGIQVARNKEKAEFLRLLKLPENAEFLGEFSKFDRITKWSMED